MKSQQAQYKVFGFSSLSLNPFHSNAKLVKKHFILHVCCLSHCMYTAPATMTQDYQRLQLKYKIGLVNGTLLSTVHVVHKSCTKEVDWRKGNGQQYDINNFLKNITKQLKHHIVSSKTRTSREMVIVPCCTMRSCEIRVNEQQLNTEWANSNVQLRRLFQ